MGLTFQGRQNGSDQGFAVDIQGGTEAIVLADNEIADTRGGTRRIAIRVGPETRAITLRNNRIQGFAKEVSGPQDVMGYNPAQNADAIEGLLTENCCVVARLADFVVGKRIVPRL
jgi:hypothetical protein